MENLKHETVTEGAIIQDRTGLVQADYLVVGAGAAGMAFVDSLIHNADVHVVLLDRRHSAGGHWHGDKWTAVWARTVFLRGHHNPDV